TDYTCFGRLWRSCRPAFSRVQAQSRDDFMSNFRGFRWCCVAAFTTLVPGALALNPVQFGPSDYVRKNFTIEDGLPDSHVNAIVQSQNGYLWVGTDGGLARFDGQHFPLVRFRGENSRELPCIRLLVHQMVTCGLEPILALNTSLRRPW